MIQLFFENTKPVEIKKEIIQWLEDIIISENKTLGNIQYIFSNDEYILQINKQYLQHNTYTDIITFDYVKGRKISCDIFISLQRVKENAIIHNSTFYEELYRVLAHGILHLCGYKDKSDDEKIEMRFKENFYLQKINN